MKKVNTLGYAKQIASLADKIKAQDIKILDLRKLTSFTDFFVVATGTSDRHVTSIADAIIEGMKKKGYMPLGTEGYKSGKWVLVDFGDVVVHIFHHSMREVYSIEKFWEDAKVVRAMPPKTKKKKAPK